MVFNKNISGFDNEFEFAASLVNKKINELNPLFENLILDLYGEIDKNSCINCFVDLNKQKTDIIININGIKKRISIKKGVKNSVHVESIYDFVEFLKSLQIKDEIIDIYLKYHFADGTNDGTGVNRISAVDYKKINQEQIDKLNLELNKVEILEQIISRFLILGRNSIEPIDAIIYGVNDDFIWILTEDIIKVVLSKKNCYSTAVHFGPLTVQPQNRCLNGNKKYEKERFNIQVKWYNLCDDIIENMNNNCVLKAGINQCF